MAKFDMSATVSNILSSLGATGRDQKISGVVLRSVEDRQKYLSLDLKKLADLPGLQIVFGRNPGVIRREPFSAFNNDAVAGAIAMVNELEKIAERKPGDAGLADAIGVIVYFGELLGETSAVGDRPPNLEKELSDVIGEVFLALEEKRSEEAKTTPPEELAKKVSAIETAKRVLAMDGLRQYVLSVFITHYPPAHEKFKTGSLDQRHPNLVTRAGSRVLSDPRDTRTLKENELNFWREDAYLNDHHGQWHVVYPRGIISQAGARLQSRNGELFVYMHGQMLARYDAERLGIGLSRVKPFDKYPREYGSRISEEIPEGYDPGPRLMKSMDGGHTWTTYGSRPAMATIGDQPADSLGPASTLAELAKQREELRDAARVGYYRTRDTGQTILDEGRPELDKDGKPILDVDGKPRFIGGKQARDKDGNRIFDNDGKPIWLAKEVDSDNFGDTIEASSMSADRGNYGDFHSTGHFHFGAWDEPFDVEDKQLDGVMLDLIVACRDPIFWRWHKHVDSIAQVWRETLGRRKPHNFNDGPPVTVRDQDIILCQKLQPGISYEEFGDLGVRIFGHKDKWDTDFSSRQATLIREGESDKKTVRTTAELLTMMRERTIRPVNPDKKMVQEDEKVVYLSHEDFFYFIRLCNDSNEKQAVTVRIFLAPEVWIEDNTAWIEMDRFRYELGGGKRAVVYRPAKLSAVIRKPAIGHEDLEKPGGTDELGLTDSWCDCGWPYNLLLPRGTKEGLECRLLVMLSPGTDLTTSIPDTASTASGSCTSISYCGARDKDYPDTKPMGYPFDRILPDSIDSIIEKHNNWASRKIKIRCSNPEFNPLR